MTTAPKRHFFSSLDSLRGIAAIMVVFHHMGWVYFGHNNSAVMHGYLAVDFFFVLSGFVIYHSYGRKIFDLRSLGRFVWLRIGRLLPLHILFLLVFVGIEFVRYFASKHLGMTPNFALFETNNLTTFISNAFLTHSLGLHDSLSYNVPSWSISVEFATYLIFAAALILLAGRARFIIVAIAVVVSNFSAISLLGKTNFDFNYDYGLLRCTGGFFLGTLTYALYDALTKSRQANPMMVTKPADIDNYFAPAILICVVVFFYYKPFHQYDMLFVPLSAGIILALVLTPNTWLSNFLEHKIFTTLGKWSYSIYLSHFAIMWVLNQGIRMVLKVPTLQDPLTGKPVIQTDPVTGLAFAGLAIMIVLIVSRFTYEWVEKPFRNMAKNMLVSRSKSTEIVTS